MIYKTIGVGGDYADIGTAINAVIALGSLSDSYTLTAISNITNATDVSVGHLAPNEKNLIFDFDGYSIVSTKKILFSAYSTGYKGLIQIKNGAVSAEGLVGALIEINGIGGAYVDDQLWDLNNLLISSQGTVGSSVEYALQINAQNASLYCRLLNLRIAVRHLSLTGAGFGIYFNGTGSGTGIKRYIENCAVYGSTKCQGITDNNLGRSSYKNVVSINEPSTAVNWQVASAETSFDNCADRDGSLVGGVNTVTGVLSSDFLSVDPTSDDFLKINSSSKLYKTGTTNISAWNTADAFGKPRPDGYGLDSIGIHEPQFYSVTLQVIHQGMLKTKTKTVTL